MIKPVSVTSSLLALLLTSGAWAQTTVYETRDAEGNVSFSDESSPDSEAVDIQRTDVADAPQPMPQDAEQPAAQGGESMQGREQGQAQGPDGEVIYGDGDDYLYDDPRLRREAVRNRENPGAIEGDAEDVRQDERRGAAGYDEATGGDRTEQADRAAERSDITGPNAEYRNTERPVHEGGGMRR